MFEKTENKTKKRPWLADKKEATDIRYKADFYFSTELFSIRILSNW